VVTASPTPDTRFEVEVTRQFDAEVRARFTNAAAGESVATDYALLSHPDADCLAGGGHRFSDSVRVTEDRRARLAFDVRLRRED